MSLPSALSRLSGDEVGIIFGGLRDTTEPGVAVAFSSASHELRKQTQALWQQLRAEHEAAAALCPKLGMRNCKELREATVIETRNRIFSAADLGTLGMLCSGLPELVEILLFDSATSSDGVQRLAEGLGAGALPAVTCFLLSRLHVGDVGASALTAALGRGALPRLEILTLTNTGISDAGLVTLAPALRRLPGLQALFLSSNPVGDEGLAALVAPSSPAGALSPPTGGLKKLQLITLRNSKVSDAGCAALVAALDSGRLPALKEIDLSGSPISAASEADLHDSLALAKSKRDIRRRAALAVRRGLRVRGCPLQPAADRGHPGHP